MKKCYNFLLGEYIQMMSSVIKWQYTEILNLKFVPRNLIKKKPGLQETYEFQIHMLIHWQSS